MHARRMGTSPLRALVVDDYVDAREMYAEYLSFKGFEVVQAQNGLQAVA
ncbi:MAG: response regulator, partial [Myxococcales bacterium]